MNKPAPDPAFILQNEKKCPVNCLFYLNSVCSQKLFLLSGYQDGDINFWDTSVKRVVTSIPNAHQKRGVLWIDQFDAFPQELITTGRDGRLVIWSLDKTWTIKDEIPICTFGFCKGCLIPRNSSSNPWIAVPSNNESEIEILCATDKKNVCRLNPKKNNPTTKYGMCMAITNIKNNENEILVGYENGAIALWDTRKQDIVDSISIYSEMVMSLCCSSLRHGWSGSVTNQLTQWSISSETGFVQFPSILLTNAGINSLKLRNDEKILATAGWDSNVRIFQVKNGKPLAVLSHHKKSIKDVAFSSDNYLAAASQDGSISLWNIYR